VTIFMTNFFPCIQASVASVVLGSVALAAWVFAVVLSYIFPPAAGHYSPATGTAGHAFILLMLLSGLLGFPF